MTLNREHAAKTAKLVYDLLQQQSDLTLREISENVGCCKETASRYRWLVKHGWKPGDDVPGFKDWREAR